jgi:citrate lyase subunit beta/citryl-CoA lyase
MAAGPSPLHGARSFLFAPGDSPSKLRRGLGSSADVLIADLEDSVAPQAKAAARRVVRDVLASADRPRPATVVRINAEGGPDDDDILAAVEAGADGIMVPKATAAVLASVDWELPVVALIETGLGLRDAYEIASMPAVSRVALGAEDLCADLGIERAAGDELPLLFARSQLVRDCAAAGAPGPVDGVFTAVRDIAGLTAAVRRSRATGLRGMLCIHPAQLEPVNEGFAPTAEQLAWARRVLDAYRTAGAAGAGVLAFEGEMIDEAVAKRAARLIGEAG